MKSLLAPKLKFTCMLHFKQFRNKQFKWICSNFQFRLIFKRQFVYTFDKNSLVKMSKNILMILSRIYSSQKLSDCFNKKLFYVASCSNVNWASLKLANLCIHLLCFVRNKQFYFNEARQKKRWQDYKRYYTKWSFQFVSRKQTLILSYNFISKDKVISTTSLTINCLWR